MELVDGVSWVDTSGGQHSASRWTASQMLRMMMMGNAGKIFINGYTILYEKIYVSLEDFFGPWITFYRLPWFVSTELDAFVTLWGDDFSPPWQSVTLGGNHLAQGPHQAHHSLTNTKWSHTFTFYFGHFPLRRCSDTLSLLVRLWLFWILNCKWVK